jgi:hypothetical protein
MTDKTLIIIMLIALMVYVVVRLIKLLYSSLFKDSEDAIEKLILDSHPNSKYYANQTAISFVLENKTDQVIDLDLCRLDKNDQRYSFTTSVNDYDKFIEYIKCHILYVFETKLSYSNDNWKDEVVMSNNYKPYWVSKLPVFVGFIDYNTHQYQSNLIVSNDEYPFGYFNSLSLKLKPLESKQISLSTTDNAIEYTERKIKCALKIINNSDKSERVNLFDKEYLDNVLRGGKIKIENIFNDNVCGYHEVVNHYDTHILHASKIDILFGELNANSEFKINFDDYKIIDFIDKNQFNMHKIVVDLKEDRFISSFGIDVAAGTEIYISFE